MTNIISRGLYANSITTGSIVQNVTSPSYTTIDSESKVISIEEYEEFQEDRTLLYALIEEGVEEWEGYDRAVLRT